MTMPLTPTSVIQIGTAPRPFAGAAVAKYTGDSFIIAGPGIYEVSISSDKTLLWREIVAPSQFAIELTTIIVNKDLGYVTCYGGHPTGFPFQPIANWTRWAISDGHLIESGFLPASRKAMGSIAGRGLVLLVGGIGGEGHPLSRGMLHSPGENPEDIFDDTIVDYSLVENTPIPTAPGVSCPQIVVSKNSPKKNLVLGTGYKYPSRIVNVQGTPKMVIDYEITLPFSGRQSAATQGPDKIGFVQVGGTDGNNLPTAHIVTWSGSVGEQPEVVDDLPNDVVQPTAFTHNNSVYVVGGVAGISPTTDCVRIDF